jgi:hypothetical protein
VQSFGVGSDGNLYVLHTDSYLNLYAPDGTLLHDFGVVQSFDMGGDGHAYYLQNSTLYHDGSPGFTISSVQSFGVGSDGNLYVLHTDSYLNRYSPDGTLLADFGVVQSFAIGGDGIVHFTLIPTSLPVETAGDRYNLQLLSGGGYGNFSFTVVSGALPPGLSLDPSTGVVTGTSLVAGTYRFTIQATGTSIPGVIGTQVCTLTVNPGAPAYITGGTFPGPTMTVNQTANITIRITDAFENACPGTTVHIANLYGSFVSVSSSQLQTNGLGEATFTLRAIYSGDIHGVPVSLTITAGPASYTFSTTVFPSLYNWTVYLGGIYTYGSDHQIIPLRAEFPETATDLATAQAYATMQWRTDLNHEYGDNWYGVFQLDSYTFSAAN